MDNTKILMYNCFSLIFNKRSKIRISNKTIKNQHGSLCGIKPLKKVRFCNALITELGGDMNKDIKKAIKENIIVGSKSLKNFFLTNLAKFSLLRFIRYPERIKNKGI